MAANLAGGGKRA